MQTPAEWFRAQREERRIERAERHERAASSRRRRDRENDQEFLQNRRGRLRKRDVPGGILDFFDFLSLFR
ncbi:hypothetical protein VD659_12040 [Herbiconiux sp. 11R-BC]|uniref:hypothetical protein n=1 Tax=Herbiconiux sp. 11R-BC TaxID=3111637 RepID=UPI003C0373B8